MAAVAEYRDPMVSKSDRRDAGKCTASGTPASSAMILAAGRGERMRPLTDDRPKTLLDAGGFPLVDWQLRAVADAGLRSVVINLGWLGGQIRQHVGDGHHFGLSVTYSDEGFPPLETGGGILNALPLLGEGPFLVINGDVWCDARLGDLRCPAGSLAHLVLVANPEHNPDGDFRLHEGQVLGRGPGAMTFSGIGIYREKLFDGCRAGRFPLAPILEGAIQRGQVTGELHRGRWFDVGDPGRLERLRQFLRRGGRAGPLQAP